MNKIGLILITSLLLITGCKTQEDPQKKTILQAERALWNEKALQGLNNKKFVLEADRIDFKYGRFAYVNASTNFISMHEDRATIQMAFNSPYAGPNGIGGITVEGRASNIKMETDKKGNVTFSMMVQGTGVSANVLIKMNRGDNKCNATITPNFNSNRINFTGNLYQEDDSNIFKGRSL
ncbi:hypothetical protein GGR21_003209 [Dysgonomonas hofstadii]|uniref:DUF4251 domain-containing protein n=1 Tax=Dysgonomonas hofstadii TaxID=637886 RepID=A0A840CXZ8_9BACT|nr:DUF4251 domain-containing protein [Dysgonomonas hofstadii]MBB4037292.1 hypothetical protein [Dysgonomonas hofstadii]